MGSEKRTSFAGRVGWVLAAAAFLALGALWRIDRARVWESPRWDDGGLIVLRAAEPEDARPESHDTRPEPEGGREPASDDGAPRAPIETWAEPAITANTAAPTATPKPRASCWATPLKLVLLLNNGAGTSA